MFYTVGTFRLFKVSDIILCLVGSADMNVWPEGIPDNDQREFYVEIGLDQTRLKATQAVKGGTLSWNEKFIL